MIRIVFNSTNLVERLRQASERLADMSPVYSDIGEYLVKSTKDRFGRSEAPDGSKWAPKRPATIERYRRMGDGKLTRPLIGPSRRLGNEVAAIPSRDQVEVGSSLEYSGVMQDGAAKGAFGTNKRGSPIPWGTIPARVWLGISETDERNILDIVDEHIGAGLTDGSEVA